MKLREIGVASRRGMCSVLLHASGTTLGAASLSKVSGEALKSLHLQGHRTRSRLIGSGSTRIRL